MALPTTLPGVLGSTAPPSPIPGAFGYSNAPGYAEAMLAAKTAYQKSLAGINNKRQQAGQTYGYRFDIDPNTGTIRNMRVDPNNPYGLFQNMLQSHADEAKQAEYAAEARHLGSGGLAAQGLTADKRSFGADSAQLGTNLMNTLEGLQQEQTGAAQQMNDAEYQSMLQATQWAIANQLFDTPDFGGGGSGGGGGGGSSGGASGGPSFGRGPSNAYEAQKRAGIANPNPWGFLEGQVGNYRRPKRRTGSGRILRPI